MSYRPPARPAWLDEVNAFGRTLGDPRALVALDADGMVAAACELTNLDDFGDDEWRAPYSTFVQSLESEGNLHLLGRLMARNEIMRSLRNRLQVIDTERRHPAIGAERITAPVLVSGTGRSGTSILHELLAQDPQHRTLLTWEALHPCPPPETSSYTTDPRIDLADREYATFWNLITPEYASMHENGGATPQEDPVLQMPTFLSDHFMGSYPVPAYRMYLARADLTPAYDFHRRMLQLLQSRHRRERWVLKSPSWLSQLPYYFATYPDGYVIITHRDPLKVLPSMTSLMATLLWQKTDDVPVDAIVQSVVRGTAGVLNRVTEMRADGRLPDERIIDVRYADLMADPWATLRSVYQRLDAEFGAEPEMRMRDYLAAKPRGRLGHRYSFADTGLDVDETRELFASYLERYDVPTED